MRSILCILLFICQVTFAQTTTTSTKSEKNSELAFKSIYPERIGYVNDFEKVFTDYQLTSLELILNDYKRKTSNEIVIVTVPSIEPYNNFDEYSIDLSNYWGVGEKEKDNGLTVIFSKTTRMIRISTGKGTEKILSDSFCQEIIDKIIIPNFKKGHYYNAIHESVNLLTEKWR